jgi:hypothetical protein
VSEHNVWDKLNEYYGTPNDDHGCVGDAVNRGRELEVMLREVVAQRDTASSGLHVYANTIAPKLEARIAELEAELEQYRVVVPVTDQDIDDAFGDRDRILALEASLADATTALEKITTNKFHIGMDENGNVFGPPDAIQCRNVARAALDSIRKRGGGM